MLVLQLESMQTRLLPLGVSLCRARSFSEQSWYNYSLDHYTSHNSGKSNPHLTKIAPLPDICDSAHSEIIIVLLFSKSQGHKQV